MLFKGKTKSLLISSQDIALLLYPVISSCRDLVSAQFKYVYTLILLKICDVTIENLIRKIQEKSPKVTLRPKK